MKKAYSDAKLEFYGNIKEIKDLYLNKGYKKQKTLFNFMKKNKGWGMTYSTFSKYFNLEIKNKNINLPVTEEPEKKYEDKIKDNQVFTPASKANKKEELEIDPLDAIVKQRKELQEKFKKNKGYEK